MDEQNLVDELYLALGDNSWSRLRLAADDGSTFHLTRLDAIEYLAELAPEFTMPPSALH